MDMRLKQNVGPVDRLARIIGGVTLVALARPPLVKAMGAYWALEGMLGYCLWYDLMNISSLPGERERQREENFPIPGEAMDEGGEAAPFSRTLGQTA
ncbi:DUF2892 domain-containing protein [Desulfofundulus thermobenzoicus]|uniref:DUF2892 domain-containing protein n=1 Tax=Desulfofundulus thermobenzoicus TaxID=29376 RepID=A0A6N7IPU7_9FIRM|nr:DUF2892 domain-containing protein [Desulfofundulus thermobenzoicus]MQL51248.1 DUF2892 domain-containing protein [Desulfofundulus thermobenzoicus]HHW43299.1 DUF2892 domain-containing protein [Desulfotomaculum sp.]